MNKNKIKILYILTAITYGGVEQLIYTYLSKLNLHNYSVDIITQGEVCDEIKGKFEKQGCNIYVLPSKKKNLIKHYKVLIELLMDNNYDVMHCNMSSKSFYYLSVAMLFNIKVRIAHAHGYEQKRSLSHKLCSMFTNMFANVRLASSKLAGDFVFGNHKYIILNNSINCELFRFDSINRNIIRKKYNISDDDILIGHIGRFDNNKNQSFIIDLLESLNECNKKNYKCILIGNGENKKNIQQRLKQNKCSEKVIFIDHTETPEVFYSAMDIFLFPSFQEGFGISILEANCSGLMSICSIGVPKETNPLNLNCYLDLGKKQQWIDKILEISDINYNRNLFYKRMLKTNYNIDNSVFILNNLYCNGNRGVE